MIAVNAHEDVAASEITSYDSIRGTLDGQKDFIEIPGGDSYSSGTNIFAITPDPFFTQGEVIVYRTECKNEAGLSNIGYSVPAVYDTTGPVISNAYGHYAAGFISCSWDVTSDFAPLLSCDFKLYRTGQATPIVNRNTGNSKSIYLNIIEENIQEGEYFYRIEATDAAGNSSGPFTSTSLIIIDNSPPVIEENSFTCDQFVSQNLEFSLAAADEQSGISEYQYCLGTINDPAIVTGNWVSIFTKTGYLSYTIDFTDLPGGIDGLPHGSEMYLSVRVKNHGNVWSGPLQSEMILVDKTPPEIPAITVPEYINMWGPNSISGIGFTLLDNESGIYQYRITVTTTHSVEGVLPEDWQVGTVLENNYPGAELADLSYPDMTFVHGTDYYVAVMARNRAGLWSVPEYSQVITCDLYPPEVVFNAAGEEIVVNDAPYLVGYTVSEDKSGPAEVTLRLFNESNITIYSETLTLADNGYTFTFEEVEYGNYILYADVFDNAGNYKYESVSQPIRVNEPPEIFFPVLETFPGMEYVFDVPVNDNDGDESFTYSWDFESDGEPDSDLKNPVHTYYHTDPVNNPVTEYTVTLTVTDCDGKSSTESAVMHVVNTYEGELYTDEYWQGTHYILGDILIPDTINQQTGEPVKLTILPGTHVVISGDPAAGYDHRLTVDGSIDVRQGVLFELDIGLFTTWNGILVNGTGSFEYATIRDAKRGITASGQSQLDISYCIFENNRTGIHLYGASPEILYCDFILNTRYGIKEDNGALPGVRGCVFRNNTHDYYHEYDTVLSYEELNEKGADPNDPDYARFEGNQGE